MITEEISTLVNKLVQEQIKAYEDKQSAVGSFQQDQQQDTQVKMVRNVPIPGVLKLDGNIRENVEFFKRMWNNYERASGLCYEDRQTKISAMLTVIGEEANRIIYNIIDSPETKSTDEVLDDVLKKLAPAINIRYERYIYNNLKQADDESYQEYFMKLKSQSCLCDYKTMEDELMIDKIICSIKDISIREKLWMKRDITLEGAIQICKSTEETKKQLEIVDKSETNEINKIQFEINSKTKENKNRNCPYCGKEWHTRLSMCPARYKTCNNCQKRGHYATMCLKKNVRKVNNQEENEVIEKLSVLSVHNKRLKDEGVYTTLKVILKNSRVKDIVFQLDTGATCSIVGEKALCDILNIKHIELTPCRTILSAVNGTKLNVKGKYCMKVRKGSHIHFVEFIVVEHDHIPLLSYKECDNLKLIKYCEEVMRIKQINSSDKTIITKQFENLQNSTKYIVEKYKDVFQGLGKLTGPVDIEIVNDRTPVKQRPRRIPVALREDLEKEIANMVEQGIIVEEEGYTDWISNVTIVKKNNKLRVCLDPTQLNQAIKDTKHQLPTLDEIIPELNKAKIFSVIDAKKGFWQVELTKQSSMLTAFWTPFGKFRYLRLPFGLSTSMEIFQKKILETVHGLKGVFVLADDILVVGYGDNIVEAQRNHDKNLEDLFIRLRKENLKLNEEKTNLCQNEIKFYGHILTSEGIKPDPSKISAIINMPDPDCKDAVLRFLGMVTYLSRYIPNLSNVTEPLRKLTRGNDKFMWTKSQKEAFLKIKQLIAEAAMLKYYDPKKPVVIQTDASSFALGCALLQDNLPVAYASKTLTVTQKNYAQIEKEMLAILFACQRFDQYICGRSNVLVETDHSPLVTIFRKPLLNTPKRLQNMILSLQRYNIFIKYKQGNCMYLADTLSRAPENIENNEKQNDIYKIVEEIEEYKSSSTIQTLKTGIGYADERAVRISDQSIERVRESTRDDQQLQQLKNQILKGWPATKSQVSTSLRCFWNYRAELTIEDDIILKQNQILIPVRLRKEFLKKLHLGHMGIEATLKLARESIFWPNIGNEIKELIQSCETCAKFASNQKRRDMKSYEAPNSAFEIISMDVFEVDIKGRKRRFLVTVDHYSDFIELDELTDMTSRTVILICKRHFSRYGVPKLVITDNGPNFASQEFEIFSDDWNFKHVTSSPHYPQSNGKAESAVKIMKRMIKKSIEENEDFYKMLLLCRNTPNKINASPSKRMFGRWLRCDVPNLEKYKVLIKSEEIKKRIEDNKYRSKSYYDRGTVKRRDLKVGENVWFKKLPACDEWSKGKVLKKEGNRSYTVKTNEGSSLRRNEKYIKPDLTSKKPCIEQKENETSKTDESVTRPSGNQEKQDVYKEDQQRVIDIQARPQRERKMPIKFKDYYLH